MSRRKHINKKFNSKTTGFPFRAELFFRSTIFHGFLLADSNPRKDNNP